MKTVILRTDKVYQALHGIYMSIPDPISALSGLWHGYLPPVGRVTSWAAMEACQRPRRALIGSGMVIYMPCKAWYTLSVLKITVFIYTF